jgi:hypothetical protein
MGGKLYFHFPPVHVKIRVMLLLFRDFAYAVCKLERGLKIGK